MIRSKISTIKIPEREKSEKGEEALVKRECLETFPNSQNNIMSQIQDHLQTAREINKNKSLSKYITVKLLKTRKKRKS